MKIFYFIFLTIGVCKAEYHILMKEVDVPYECMCATRNYVDADLNVDTIVDIVDKLNKMFVDQAMVYSSKTCEYVLINTKGEIRSFNEHSGSSGYIVCQSRK